MDHRRGTRLFHGFFSETNLDQKYDDDWWRLFHSIIYYLLYL